MAELADAHGSGPCEGNFMEVRILLSAPIKTQSFCSEFFYWTGTITPYLRLSAEMA